MKNKFSAAMIAGGLLGALIVGGCTQMPTEKQSISDMRPQISFKAADDRARSARVIVDGLDMGVVGDYVEGSTSLRVLSGTHSLRVIMGNQIALDEKFYVGDGTNRTFIVK